METSKVAAHGSYFDGTGRVLTLSSRSFETLHFTVGGPRPEIVGHHGFEHIAEGTQFRHSGQVIIVNGFGMSAQIAFMCMVKRALELGGGRLKITDGVCQFAKLIELRPRIDTGGLGGIRRRRGFSNRSF